MSSATGRSTPATDTDDVDESTTRRWLAVQTSRASDLSERPAIHPGQVGGSSRWHCESNVCCRLICIISIRRRCGFYSGWGHESVGWRPRMASNVPRTCLHGCLVLQLLRTGPVTSDKCLSYSTNRQKQDKQTPGKHVLLGGGEHRRGEHSNVFKVWVVICNSLVWNLVLFPVAKEFLKSFKIWHSFHQSLAANFEGYCNMVWATVIYSF